MVPPRKTFGNGYLAFFRGFLRHPSLIGSVIPSSRFLERRVVEVAGIAHSRSVVELGPGTGGITRAPAPCPGADVCSQSKSTPTS
jgi:phospholipid N-methyltransferase